MKSKLTNSSREIITFFHLPSSLWMWEIMYLHIFLSVLALMCFYMCSYYHFQFMFCHLFSHLVRQFTRCKTIHFLASLCRFSIKFFKLSFLVMCHRKLNILFFTLITRLFFVAIVIETSTLI